MVHGEKRKITREYILSRILSFDIFKQYMPHKFTLNRPCRSPFTDDRHPSMIIGNKFGDVTFKCFNSENRGDAIAFVMQYFGISYLQALDKIASDFKLIEGKSSSIIEWETPKIITQPIFLQAVAKPYTEADRAYLAQYHLTPRDLNFCGDTKAHSTLEWSINRRKQVLKKDEVCFYYHLKNERGEWIKVYRPNAPKDVKWRSSIPFYESHGIENLKSCDIGFVQKSIKDGAVMAKFISPHVCVTQAEDLSALSKDNIDFINQNCKKVFVVFDSDERGVKSCTAITKMTGWNYINPPKSLLKEGITDISDWIKIARPQVIIDFFKEKGAII